MYIHCVWLESGRERQRPPFLVTTSVSTWKNLVDDVMALILDGNNKECDIFEIRGDTVATILALVEGNIVEQIEGALLMSLHRHSEPDIEGVATVSLEDFTTHYRIYTGNTHRINIFPSDDFQELVNKRKAFGGVDRCSRDRIVDSLALRAGVFKMDDEVRELGWAMMLQILKEVLTPAVVSLRSEVETEPQTFHRSFRSKCAQIPPIPRRKLRVKCLGQSPRLIPPLPRLSEMCCPHCRKIALIYTIVPRQIETAAVRLGLSENETPAMICSGEWLDEENHEPECKDFSLEADYREVEGLYSETEMKDGRGYSDKHNEGYVGEESATRGVNDSSESEEQESFNIDGLESDSEGIVHMDSSDFKSSTESSDDGYDSIAMSEFEDTEDEREWSDHHVHEKASGAPYLSPFDTGEIDYLADDEESSDEEDTEDERDMDLADSFLDADEVTEVSERPNAPACPHPVGFVPCNTLPDMFVSWEQN